VAQILLINGPNLNLLGQREPNIYGAESLAQIEADLSQMAEQQGHQLHCFQSNSESDIIARIHAAAEQHIDFIIINPAAFTHTSVAIRDALAAVAIEFIEVHLSNPHAREPFRHRSYFSDLAKAVIAGCGADGYRFALQAASRFCAANGNQD